MKVLYILKSEPDETVRALLNAHKAEHTVSVIEIASDRDYAGIVSAIEEADKVISA